MSNANFLGKIEHIAGPLTRVSASNADLGTANVSNLIASDFLLSQFGYNESVLVAFAPTGFGTLAVGGGLGLLTECRSTAATGTGDSRLATLPNGAFVTKVLADNNGTTIAGSAGFTLSLGNGGATGPLPLMSPTTASLNATGGIQRNLVFGPNSTGPTGVSIASLDPAGLALTASGRTTLSVHNDGAINTAGDLRVIVHYYSLANC